MLLQPRGDQADRLLRAIDDVALGELDEAVREGEEPGGRASAEAPAERALEVVAAGAAGGRGCEADRAGRSRTTRSTR